jgi:hypothetical protein
LSKSLAKGSSRSTARESLNPTTTATQHDEAQLFARVARELAAEGGLQATLDRISGMARILSGCDAVMLWIVNRLNQPLVSATTDPVYAETHAKAFRADSAR